MTSKKLKKTSNTSVGRPTKFNRKWVEKTKELMATGKSENVAIRELGISRDTFYRWKREHPEFLAAINDGKVYGQSVHEEIIEAIAQGRVKGASVAAYQMLMRNVYGWDKNQDANVSQTINIGQMNFLENKSVDELVNYIQDVSEDVKGVIDVTEFQEIEDGTNEKD